MSAGGVSDPENQQENKSNRRTGYLRGRRTLWWSGGVEEHNCNSGGSGKIFEDRRLQVTGIRLWIRQTGQVYGKDTKGSGPSGMTWEPGSAARVSGRCGAVGYSGSRRQRGRPGAGISLNSGHACPGKVGGCEATPGPRVLACFPDRDLNTGVRSGAVVGRPRLALSGTRNRLGPTDRGRAANRTPWSCCYRAG